MAAVKQAITTPKGEFRWAYITRSKPNLSGVEQFSIDVVMSEEDADPLITQINAFWDEHRPKHIKKPPKSTGYKVLEDGQVCFTFKTGAVMPDGKPAKVKVYDASAKEFDLGDRLIGNGSRGRVAGFIALYEASKAEAGTTLYLSSVQLTKAVWYEGSGASFEADDDDEAFVDGATEGGNPFGD